MNFTHIELYQLQTLAAIMSHGSMSKAAEALHTTRQSIARSISALEAQIGQKLFERNFSGMIPTEFCKLFYPYASQVVSSVDNLVDFAKSYDATHRTINFGVLGLYDTGMLIASLLKDFQRHNPGITTELKYKPWPEIHDAVLSGELDYAYTSIIPGHMPKELKCIPVVEGTLSVVTNKNDELAAFETISPQQLQDKDIILYTRFGIQTLYMDNYQKEHAVHYRPYITTYELGLLTDTIKNGGVIGLMDTKVAESVSASSDSLVFKALSPSPTRCTGFICRKDLSASSAHKKLLNFLKPQIIEHMNI